MAEPSKFVALAENLEDMDREALTLAFAYMERNRRTQEGMPTPAEVRELGARLLKEKREKDKETLLQREMSELKRRKAEGEEFFGIGDLLKAMQPILQDNPLSDEELAQRRTELQRQKVELCKR